MKTMKKLIPALAMLLVSAVLLGTSTFAWFSMNQTVYVSGMQVKTRVSSNLLVSETAEESGFQTAITQARAALLEPVSTVDGVSFFYHTNDHIDGAGKATDDTPTYVAYSESVELANTNAGKTHVSRLFNERYSVAGTGSETGDNADAKFVSKITAANMSGMVAPAYGYVDYTFYLKATSDANDSVLTLTVANLMYEDGAIPGTEKAWRVGVLASAGQTDISGLGSASTTLKSILTLSGAANSYTGKAVDSATSRADVSYNTAPTLDNDLDAGVTKYYKVIVRLWLEGEDTTCNNATYASLTNAWKLELKYDLGASPVPAANITSAASILTP